MARVKCSLAGISSSRAVIGQKVISMISGEDLTVDSHFMWFCSKSSPPLLLKMTVTSWPISIRVKKKNNNIILDKDLFLDKVDTRQLLTINNHEDGQMLFFITRIIFSQDSCQSNLCRVKPTKDDAQNQISHSWLKKMGALMEKELCNIVNAYESRIVIFYHHSSVF